MGGQENKPMKHQKTLSEHSPLTYVLVGLIPYTKPNLLLTFKPKLFFREIERISKYKQSTLRSAYWRAHQQGLLKKHQDIVMITTKGRQKVAPFIAQKLHNSGQLMVIFDIPEDQKSKRQQFRQVLKQWQFTQIQKSVWSTDKDYKEELADLIQALDLDECIEVYECAKQFPR
jgi:phenylacetic acid degradation operon negative regulatory protein